MNPHFYPMLRLGPQTGAQALLSGGRRSTGESQKPKAKGSLPRKPEEASRNRKKQPPKALSTEHRVLLLYQRRVKLALQALHSARGASGNPEDSTAGVGQVARRRGKHLGWRGLRALTWAAWHRLSCLVSSPASGQSRRSYLRRSNAVNGMWHGECHDGPPRESSNSVSGGVAA